MNDHSTKIGKNFAETLQFEDLAVIFFFFLRAYFCEQNLESVANAFFKIIERKKCKTFCGKKVLVCLKGPLLNPSNTLRIFPQNGLNFFLQHSQKMHLIPIQDFFTKECTQYERQIFLTARSSNCSVSAKIFPMWVEKPYFGGVINSKTYLNHELCPKFFFLSILAYK